MRKVIWVCLLVGAISMIHVPRAQAQVTPQAEVTLCPACVIVYFLGFPVYSYCDSSIMGWTFSTCFTDHEGTCWGPPCDWVQNTLVPAVRRFAAAGDVRSVQGLAKLFPSTVRIVGEGADHVEILDCNGVPAASVLIPTTPDGQEVPSDLAKTRSAG